jgi:hypothetical protein
VNFPLKAFLGRVDDQDVPVLRHSPSSSARRPYAWLLVLVVAALALTGLAASPVSASPEDPAADESAFVAALNATRSKGGLPPLAVDVELRSLARDWAQHQADAGTISHANPISAGVTADWLKLGENVGMGGTVTAIMNAFIKSPGHYANIMDPEFTRVGVGVVWSGNTLFTTHRFMKVAGAEAQPAPAPPAPAPEAAPVPAPAPEAAPPAPTPSAARAPRAATPPTTTAPAAPAPAPPPPPPASPGRVASVLALLRSAPA